MKDTHEIDFKTDDILYQVSYEMNNPKTRQRELKAFKHLDEKDIFKHKLINKFSYNKIFEIYIKF